LLLTRLADEADAFADDRADQPLLLAGVADGSAGGVDAAGKRRVGDDPPAPDRSQQIVSADDAIAVSGQEFKDNLKTVSRLPQSGSVRSAVVYNQLLSRQPCDAGRREGQS